MVRAPALHQQGRGFESRRLDLFLGCWTYDQCNPSVWGAEVYTRILRPGEDMWKITRMSSEHDPPVPARKPPLLLSLIQNYCIFSERNSCLTKREREREYFSLWNRARWSLALGRSSSVYLRCVTLLMGSTELALMETDLKQFFDWSGKLWNWKML